MCNLNLTMSNSLGCQDSGCCCLNCYASPRGLTHARGCLAWEEKTVCTHRYLSPSVNRHQLDGACIAVAPNGTIASVHALIKFYPRPLPHSWLFGTPTLRSSEVKLTSEQQLYSSCAILIITSCGGDRGGRNCLTLTCPASVTSQRPPLGVHSLRSF